MRGRLALAGGLAIVALAALVLMVILQVPPPAPAPPAPGPTPTPAPTPPPSPTPTPEPSKTGTARFVVSWATVPAPTPPPLEEVPPRGVEPTPTPPPSECVTLTWSVGTIPRKLGGILVDVDLRNGCGRDLAPLDVWFQVNGYRHGDLVQSVRGHPFDPIERDGEGKAHIVLPGSYDWYDRIEVFPVEPGPL